MSHSTTTSKPSSVLQTFGRTRIGRALRFALHPQRSLQRKRGIVALADEVMKLGIVESKHDGDWPAISLADGKCFHGRPPVELDRSVYQQLSRQCRSVLPERCVGVAVDVVCRYVYPQAVVAITPPMPLSYRSVMHRQHRDTIGDLPDSEFQLKQELLKHFTIGEGDVVLDVGGYIGMGAMRLSRLVGSAGRVVSVETQPLNQEILLKNLESNNITNVTLVRGAGFGERQVRWNCNATLDRRTRWSIRSSATKPQSKWILTRLMILSRHNPCRD